VSAVVIESSTNYEMTKERS